MTIQLIDPKNYVGLIDQRDGFFKRISQVTPIYFLTEADILMIQHYLIQRYGGLEGIKDEGYLSYLCNMVEEKYDHLYRSAFLYLWSIVKRHALNDGNKRTGAACMLWFLEMNGETWKGNLGQLEYLIMAISTSKIQENDAFIYFLRCSGWIVP
jgi:death on curing protein